jgi:hypothetical protein
MTNAWTTFFNALVDVCEEYNKAKEKADAKKAEMQFIEDIFGESAECRGEVVTTMIDAGWKSYEMDAVLPKVNTAEKAKVATHLIKSGNYRYYEISRLLEKL